MSDRIRGAVIVAAGGSRRMGRSKPLLRLAGRTLVEWHVERLAAHGPVVVVVGCEADAVIAAVGGRAAIVLNAAWATSAMIDSVALGLRAFAGPAVVTPVDAAPVRSETIEALLAVDGDAIPVHRGVAGHPVRLSGPTADRVRTDPPERGLRALLGSARRVEVDDPEIALDADDPATWAAFVSRWRP